MLLDKHRLHLSSQPLEKTDLKNSSNHSRISGKPRGVWFACGTEWMKWVKTGGMIDGGVSIKPIDWIRMGITRNDFYLYHFEIDMSRILQIETPSQFEEFQRKYGEFVTYERYQIFNECHAIRWHEVEANYAGIQICPYMYQPLLEFQKKNFRFESQDEENSFRLWQRFYSKSSWYHGWDVASGCIWDTSVIKKVILVGTKKQRNVKFETWPVMNKIEHLQRNRNINPIHDIPESF